MNVDSLCSSQVDFSDCVESGQIMNTVFRAKLCVILVAMTVAVGCGQAPQTRPPGPRGIPPSQIVKAPKEAPAPGPMPFTAERESFMNSVKSAVPLDDQYPTDPNAYVSLELEGSHLVTTAMGAAIWRGDRTQIERYLAAGADINRPIWYQAGDNPPEMSSSSHMAINAIYTKRAETDFMEFILTHNADPNALLTSFEGDQNQPKGYSQCTVLFHTVTSGIPELTKILFQHGVKDANRGAIRGDVTMSPLMTAIQRRNLDAVKLLLDNGADTSQGRKSQKAGDKSCAAFAEEMVTRAQNDDQKQKSEAILQLFRTLQSTERRPAHSALTESEHASTMAR